MPLSRPKHPDIYDRVKDWYKNDEGVVYIAHMILDNGDAIALKSPPEEGQGTQNLASNHPDQRFWTQNTAAIKHALQKAHGLAVDAARQKAVQQGNDAPDANSVKLPIARIEIDCPLLPCTGQGGCLFRVPALVQNFDLINGVKLRIFSHRDEQMGKGAAQPSSKRYMECLTTDGNNALPGKYNAHDGWGWAPYCNKNAYV